LVSEKGLVMAVRCIFFIPDEGKSCQVLQLANAAPIYAQTRRQLETKYCTSGRFIACPIFARVERSLVQANQMRGKMAKVRTTTQSTSVLQAVS
jgi:hypothetical protein